MEDQTSSHGGQIETVEISDTDHVLSQGAAPNSGRGNKICCGAAACCCCLFSDAETASRDAKERSGSMRKLLMAVSLCIVLMSIEVVCGIKAKSLAILADAAHLLTDVAAFAISIFSLWIAGRWEATLRHSYGFFRIEILGALLSILLTWLLAGILVYEAINRIIHVDRGDQVQGFLMFGVAASGLVVNIIVAVFLGHDHHHRHGNHHEHGEQARAYWNNVNVQGAYLHALGDSIQNIGVIIGGGIIWYKPQWKIIDPICTLIFSFIVVGTTIKMLRNNIFEVLMESTPREIDASRVEKGLCDQMEEVVAVHELHIWAITLGKPLLTCHVTITRDAADADHLVLDKLVDYIRTEYNIHHVTIQIERQS